MQVAHYTAHNICHALTVGQFEPQLDASTERVLRLLLTPSFHAEVCLTFRHRGAGVDVDVVTARSQIWRQESLAPTPALVDKARGDIAQAAFDELLAHWQEVVEPRAPARIVILDGMRGHAICVRSARVDQVAVALRMNPAFDRFVAAALSLAWNVVDNPRVRNAIADAGDYAQLDLPRIDLPPDKPVFRTMVLGSDVEATQLLDALQKHHPR